MANDINWGEGVDNNIGWGKVQQIILLIGVQVIQYLMQAKLYYK